MSLEDLAGTGHRTCYTGDQGPATQAALDLPCAVAIDPDGDPVELEQANQVIRRIDRDGTIHRIAGQCVIDDVQPCAGGQQPVACPAPSDKTTCGDLSTCDGVCSRGFAGDGDSALAMRMGQPLRALVYPAGRMVFDRQGQLYFADTGNNRVRMIDTAGMVHTVAGTGERGSAGDGGPATEAELAGPVDLALAADGTLYIADTRNNCVRRVDPGGVISTVAGRCHTTAAPTLAAPGDLSERGSPTEVELNWPLGLDLAGDRLYISDTFNQCVRAVNL